MKNRRLEILIIIILLVIALLPRLYFRSDGEVTPDSILYFQLAEKISEGEWQLDNVFTMQNILQPGYSLAMYSTNLLWHDIETSSRVVSIIAGVLLVLLVYAMGRRMFGKQVGILAAVFTALHPMFISYSVRSLTEPLFALLFLLIAYLFYEFINRTNVSYWWFVLIGFLIGCCYLVRLVGLSMLGVIIIWLLIYIILKRVTWQRALITLGIVVGSLVITMAPYLGFLYQQNDSLVLTGIQGYAMSSNNTYFGSEAKDDDYEKRRAYLSLSDDSTDYKINQEDIGSNGGGSYVFLVSNYFRLFIKNISTNLWYVIKAFSVYLILIIISILFYRRNNYKLRKIWFLLSIIPVYLAIYYIDAPGYRYDYRIIPIIFLGSAVGTTKSSNKIGARELRFGAIVTIIALVFIADAIFFRGFSLKPYNNQATDQNKEIGYWIKNNFSDQYKKILSTSSEVAYYAELEYYPVPFAEFEDLFSFAKHNSIDLLLVSDKDSYYHDLHILLDDIINDDSRSEISLLLTGDEYSIYQVN